jgi:hypothetical protein
MRSIDSALSLGRKLGLPVTLQWFRNSELNCPFSNLFVFPSDILNVVDVAADGRLGRLRHFMTPYFYQLRGYSQISQAQIAANLHYKNIANQTQTIRSLYISTCSRFFENDTPFSDFSLAPHIAMHVEQYRGVLRYSIGVHIRRTDNNKSIEAASVDDFIAALESEIDHDRSVQFFVATDDQEVLNRLQTRFGKRIQFHRKRSYCRTNPLAIEDALIDLYALASCRRLIGSYWSSFTDTAMQIGNIETRIIKGKK